MFQMWVLDMNANMRKLFQMGIVVIFWTICLSQNNVIFNKSFVSTSMQVIYKDTHCITNGQHFKRSASCYEVPLTNWKS
jgi:hypothetical protein